MSSGPVGRSGAGAFRLITFGGELTPETSGSGSSLCTTEGAEGSLPTVDTSGSLVSSVDSDFFFTSCDSVRVMWIVGGGDCT